MENPDSIWLIAVIALLAGALIGALAHRWHMASAVRQADEARSELERARSEFEAYKTRVDLHFDKTSELVGELTQNYARVYRHLADGAQTLGNSGALTELLDRQRGRVLTAVDDEPAPTAARAGDTMVDDGRLHDAGREEAADEAAALDESMARPDKDHAASDNADDLGWEPAAAGSTDSRAAGNEVLLEPVDSTRDDEGEASSSPNAMNETDSVNQGIGQSSEQPAGSGPRSSPRETA